jgi:hypothetical protein
MKEIIDEGRVLNFKTMVSHCLGNDGKNKKNDQNVEKYCDYGCYCLPLGDKDNWVGAGEPVDEIDELCHQLWQCYKCLQLENDKRCNGRSNYDWTLNGSKAKCLNPKRSCDGQVCQCDITFATRLAAIQDTYKKEYHRKNGFDRRQTCKKRPSKKYPDENNKVGKAVPRECCGKGFDRTIFKPIYQECCNDGTVRDIGEC